ncbi:hypothetical protein EAL2_c18820 [Peptoclostridium acidaminophilum DSM 3953]|uniref:Uncharacterized protein n=1 Tax=Peptoclostridium acidaminophilum DSM 3953 TaxID=1286171 RepID=W8TH77_PEPAC|nr:hypothetical protein EAL2_c18820 [Peptoclostridium acidaminophilum DSM 3953]
MEISNKKNGTRVGCLNSKTNYIIQKTIKLYKAGISENLKGGECQK